MNNVIQSSLAVYYSRSRSLLTPIVIKCKCSCHGHRHILQRFMITEKLSKTYLLNFVRLIIDPINALQAFDLEEGKQL